MKAIKYIIASLAIAVAIAGCAGGSGTSNLDSYHNYDRVDVERNYSI